MKKLLVLSSLLLGLSATAAFAQVIDIAWEDMGTGCTAGERLNTFNCAVNTAANNRHIVTSFVNPNALGFFVGMTLNMKLVTDGTTLPAWWQGQAGGCRSGVAYPAPSSPAAVGLLECGDPWGNGAFIGAVTQVNDAVNLDRAAIVSDLATDIPQQLAGGGHYYGQYNTLAVIRSTGTGSCAGCQAGACILLDNIQLFQVAGSPGGDVITLRNGPGTGNAAYLTWQGPIDDPGGCPGATPTQRSSWGQVKSLYR
jgi:hypothetical protein